MEAKQSGPLTVLTSNRWIFCFGECAKTTSTAPSAAVWRSRVSVLSSTSEKCQRTLRRGWEPVSSNACRCVCSAKLPTSSTCANKRKHANVVFNYEYNLILLGIDGGKYYYMIWQTFFYQLSQFYFHILRCCFPRCSRSPFSGLSHT